MIISSLLPGLNAASLNCLLRKGNKQHLNEVWIWFFVSVTSRGCTASVSSADTNLLILLLGNAKGKTGHKEITWFIWSYRMKLVLKSEPLRTQLHTWPPHTTTGKSLHLTKLQLPSCEARIRRALFSQALVWVPHAACEPRGAHTDSCSCYVEQLWFYNNHQEHSVNPRAPKPEVPGNTTERVHCSPVLPPAFGCRLNF